MDRPAPRILWIDTTGWYGGACRSMVEIVTRLHRSGKVRIAIAIPDGPIRERLRQLGLEILPLSRVHPMHPTFSHPFITLRWPVDLEWTQSEVAELATSWHPDIIHANTWAAAMAVPKGIPCIWHVRDYPVHPLPVNLAARHARKIIAPSPAVECQLARLLPPSLRGKVIRIDNGIDIAHTLSPLSRLEARKKLGLPAQGRVVGMAGTYAPWRNHDLFLDTARIISSAGSPSSEGGITWVIAGEDPRKEQPAFENKLHRLAEALGDHVRLLGHVEPDLLLPSLDLLVHPAVNEPFGRIICEAMAFGVPVVAHRSGGPVDILEGGVHGMLVDEKTPEAFADAIRKALEIPPAEIGKKVEMARERVRRIYDVDRVAETLTELYTRRAE